MSYSFQVIGRDKEKLKEAIRASQAHESSPHSGTPPWVVDHLCKEVDRCRIYEYAGKRYALSITASGSFHEQGGNDTFNITQVQLVE